VNYLLDTNVISEWTKPVPTLEVVRWLVEADEDRLFLSVVSIAEISRGIELLPPGDRKRRLRQWLSNDLLIRFENRILAIDEKIADAWGIYMAKSQQLGVTMSSMDAFLAATALSYKMTLVTRNTPDFQHLQIAVINPW